MVTRGMMGKTISGACATLILGGSVAATPATAVFHGDYLLTSEALVMIPAFNQRWLDLSNQLYLQPNGFEGTPTFLQVPETYDLNSSVSGVVNNLVNAVETRWDANDFSAEDPLYIFGYSQAAVGAGMAEQQLADYGIPSDALHFVLVGDSASANGGFLNEFMDTLFTWFPASWRQSVEDSAMAMLHLYSVDSVIGASTPDDLYPTDVYTLSGDGWANWAGGANSAGMFWDHLAYLGLTPEEIATATKETFDQTTYFTIDSANVDMWQALMNSLDMIMAGLFPS